MLCLCAGFSINSRIARAISVPVFAIITSTPGFRSSPLMPAGVLTTALPIAIASMILIFVPAEATSGATTKVAR